MNKNLIILILLSFCFSCKQDDDVVLDTQGDLVITVKLENTPVNEGVEVFTIPETTREKTDAFGQVRFSEIDKSEYSIYTFMPDIGSAKKIVSISDEFTSIELNITEGVHIEPEISITPLPLENYGFAPGENITIEGNAINPIAPDETLLITWDSDKDGILYEGQVNDEGKTVLQTNQLSPNVHIITLKATNSLGVSSTKQIEINTLSPSIPELSLENENDFDTKLSWNNLGTDVSNIDIYRSIYPDSFGTVITSIEDVDSNNYTDILTPYGDTISYYIVVTNQAGYSRKSNIVTTNGPKSFNINAENAVFHPTEPYVYIKSNNNIITILNYETQEILLEKDLGGVIGNFTIGDNGYGLELYMPNSDGWVYIYDPLTLEEKASINVGASAVSVETNNNGFIIVSSDDSDYTYEENRIFDRSTLNYIDSDGDFHKGILKILPSNNELISISVNISPIDMDYYQFDDEGFFTSHSNDRYHGDHPLDPYIFKIAPANNFLITSKEGAVYSADSNMEYLGVLPRLSEKFSDFEFNSDASIIYAGLSTDKKIYTYQSSNLNKIEEIPTRGYAWKMKKIGNKLIILNSTSPIENHYPYDPIYVEEIAVEIIEL